MGINDCDFFDAESNGEDLSVEYKDEDKEVDLFFWGG